MLWRSLGQMNASNLVLVLEILSHLSLQQFLVLVIGTGALMLWRHTVKCNFIILHC